MGLDTSWTDNVPIKDIVKTGGDVAKTFSDNATRRHVSDNELAGKYDDNRRAEYQTTSNNNLAAFMGVLNTSLAIVNGLVSVVNTAINAYKDIQLSHDQVRIAQIQAAAYVESKREETRQVQIQQEQETVRYLASLKADLEQKRMEIEKFQMELADRREEREFSREKWRRQVARFEKITEPIIDYANTLRGKYVNSHFEDKNIREELQRNDEKLFAYAMQIKEIYK